MPVGTYGTVKGVTPEELVDCGAEIILAQYVSPHAEARRGDRRAHGGLHGLMGWTRPILTDSGGYQVFSLAAMRKLTEEGVEFRSPVDGAEVFLDPERAMQIQRALGSDIAMVFDECTPYPARRGHSARLHGTLAALVGTQSPGLGTASLATEVLFGIIQGGMHEALRLASLEGLERQEFAGLAIGGLSVGEPPAERERVLQVLLPAMPVGKPRYLMGVGRPEDLVDAVQRASTCSTASCRLAMRGTATCSCLGRHEHPQRALCRRYGSRGPWLWLLHLPAVQPRLPAALDPCGEMLGPASRRSTTCTTTWT